MKTAEQQLQRMEDLVRKMARQADVIRATKGFTAAPFELLGEEARAIVSELPEPVDAYVLVAREIAADNAYRDDTDSYKRVIDGLDDNTLNVKTAIAAIAKGRQLEREGR